MLEIHVRYVTGLRTERSSNPDDCPSKLKIAAVWANQLVEERSFDTPPGKCKVQVQLLHHLRSALLPQKRTFGVYCTAPAHTSLERFTDSSDSWSCCRNVLKLRDALGTAWSWQGQPGLCLSRSGGARAVPSDGNAQILTGFGSTALP